METKYRWAGLAALLTAEAMNLLDATITQVAAPVVHADLPGPDSDVQWFAVAFTLPFALLLVAGGRLGDVHGRRRVFRLGIAVFTLASLGCAAAWSADALIAWRVVQGASAALVVPQTLGLIRAMFSGGERARALGAIGPVMGLAAVGGPVLGGLVTAAWSWRAAFLVNVPLGLAVLAAVPWLVEDRVDGRPAPVLRLAVRSRFLAALGCVAAFFAVVAGLPLVVVLGLDTDVLTAAVALLPWSGGLALASWAAGAWLVPRFGTRVVGWGLGVLTAGLVLVAAGPLPVALALCGLGAGAFTAPFFTAALDLVGPAEVGAASGLINTAQQLGGSLGVVVLGGVFFATGTGWACAAAVGFVLCAGALGRVLTRPFGGTG